MRVPVQVNWNKGQTGRSSVLGYLAVLSVLVLAVIAAVVTHQPTRNAQRFMKDLMHLEVGKSSFTDALDLSKRYGGIEWKVNDSPEKCTPERCYLAFPFENTWLHRLHLAPRIVLMAIVGVENGQVRSRLVGFASATRTPSIEVFANERLAFSSGEAYRIVSYSAVPRLGIELTPLATSDQRQRAYAFNLSCLSKIGGCGDAGELLPSLTQKNQQGNK